MRYITNSRIQALSTQARYAAGTTSPHNPTVVRTLKARHTLVSQPKVVPTSFSAVYQLLFMQAAMRTIARQQRTITNSKQ
jgi:hypothetical protein